MSDTTYFPNTALVQSGDLFKIMELRYSHSIYDEDGYYNVKKPVSNSLELIRWYRNCEIYFWKLATVEKDNLLSNEIDLCEFREELEKLKIDPEVFLNFGITEYSKDCLILYNELQLKKYRQLVQSKKDEIEFKEWLRDIYPVRDELQSIAKQTQRFNLSSDYQVMLEGLHEFLKNTESTYCLAFDVEVKVDQFKDNCSTKWLDRAKTLKLIIEDTLERFFLQQNDVLRAYVKFEDDGIYGYRFHTIVFLSSITLTEQAWLANFNERLQNLLAKRARIKTLLESDYLKPLSKIKDHRGMPEQVLSNKRIREIEKEFETDIESFYQISFQLINWNSRLRDLQPDLRFEIGVSSTTEDMRLLEYWALKYLFMSNHYIYFNPHNAELQPSVKCFTNQVVTLKHRVVNLQVPLKLAKDTKPRVINRATKPKLPNDQATKSNEKAVLPQRRSGDSVDAFYNAERDFTNNMPLASVTMPKPKPKFEKQEVEKTIKIDVGAPSDDLVEDSSTLYTMQDFIDYIFDEKKKSIYKAEIKNKPRVSWAEIFYKNSIRDAELLEFLIKFERFIDTLLHSENPFFSAKLQHGCSPEGLSSVGGQYLRLFYNFHTQQIKSKLEATNIESDYWNLVIKPFEYHFVAETYPDISQVKMHKAQIQTLNDLMKNARVLAKQYEKKMQAHLQYLKYADAKLWQKAFDQERIMMRYQFNLPYPSNGKKGIRRVFNSFKSRLSGDGRSFHDVRHISLCLKKNQSESLDVVLLFDNAQGAEDQKWLSQHVKELWGKAVNAEMRKQDIKVDPYDSENIIRCVDLIPKHEQLAVKYLYIRNCEVAIEKSVISHLIPYFISQAIFLQDVSSNPIYKLTMSQYLTSLFDKKTSERKNVSTTLVKPSKPKKLIAD
ncbi:hypothetical protein M5F04_14890 [Acinetobacter sp. ANC 7200]|uniref:hypothetical protein n=1 Tax=Acinetobacter amyesii TaxID=2942470 RepID=UPI0020BDB575|nr:hypothetical protein [Acinetobacter amyesii]MCL6245820.1 hypothetical protein [Acinetobacter amyesii]